MQAPTFPTASLLVASGGAVGAWARYLVGRATNAILGPVRATDFPWATLTCNVAGSLFMGLLVGWLARHGAQGGDWGGDWGGEHWRLLLGVGVLGGFTTFSAFSMECAMLVERGVLGMAAGYVALSLIASFAGLFAGLWLMRSFA
jgi:CrcB protein